MIEGIFRQVAALVFGLFNLAAFMVFAALEGAFFRSTTEEEKKQLAIAQDNFWSLSKAPFDLKHKFYTLKNGVRLHYVENLGTGAPKNLTIFIHGFPDSWLLWRRLLTSPRLAEKSVLIGVDLPGYGGSDGIPKYNAEGVMETMTSFILGMREQYGQVGGKVYIVSHDWGSVVAFRLASEAPQLADRFIAASCIIPQHALSNAKTHFASGKQMLHTWIQQPFQLRLLKRAFQTCSPILTQASKSGYVFVFNLPRPFSNFAGRMGNLWLPRVLYKVSNGKIQEKRLGELEGLEAAEAMAISTGPGAAQASHYPDAVKERVKDLGWSEKIRLYREGLLWGPWEKSLETIVRLSELDGDGSPRRSSSGAGLFEDGPPGSLKAPTTVIYGKKDLAFEPRLAIEGIADYLVRGSQVVVLNEGGHWLPNEKQGGKVLEEAVAWALEGEKTKLKQKLDGLKDVRLLVEK